MILNVRNRNIIVHNANNQISYNSDYIAEFHFDDEWNGKVKTARFVQNGEYFDVVLVDDKCVIPPLKTGFIRVGVFTDSMTSTYADVYFKTSIKDGSGNPTEPPEDVYAQLTALIESGMLKGLDGLTPYIGENGNWWIGDEDSGVPAQGNSYVVTEADYDAIAEKSSEKLQPTITELNNTKVGYSEVINNQLLMYSDSTKEKLLATLDLPSEGVSDVQINGTSIVADGVADIKASGYGIGHNDVGLYLVSATNSQINARKNSNISITPIVLDYAVKSAMCDGKGAEWTAEEQAMARARIGLPGDFELVADIELTEKTRVVSINFEKYLRELYVVFSGTATREGNAGIDVYFGDGTRRRYAPTCPGWMNTSKKYAIAHIRLNQGVIYSEATNSTPTPELSPVNLCTNLNGFMLLTETQNSIKGIDMQSLNNFSWNAGCKFTVYGVRA